MSRSTPFILALALGAITVSMAAAHEALKLPGIDWHARAEKWFKSEEEKARKDQMKEASRALKRPCKYCHTEDFEGFTDKKEVAQQMMAVSIENDVECKDCHDGRDKLTEMGEKADKMWDVAREKGVFCDDCHPAKTKFKELTDNGKKAKAEWDAKKGVATPPPPSPGSTTP